MPFRSELLQEWFDSSIHKHDSGAVNYEMLHLLPTIDGDNKLVNSDKAVAMDRGS